MKTVLLTALLTVLALPAMAEHTVYDRVMESRTIRCSYAIYPPTMMKDANTGEMSGIFHDVIEEVAALHELSVEWTEEVPYGSIIEGMKAGRYDLFCAALWPNAPRAQQGLFTVPLYYSGVNMYVRPDDTRFDAAPYKILNNPAYSIAIQDGDIIDSIARESFPNAGRVTIPQMSQSSEQFILVTTKKADVALAERSFANSFLAKNPEALKNVTLDNPIRVFPNVYMLPAHEMQLKNMLDTGITQLINSGRVNELIQKYESKGVYYPVAKPYQVGE